MSSFREIENPQYGICLNSCKCQLFNTSRSPKTYEVIKRGSLAKFQYRNHKNDLVRTLVTNKSEVYMKDYLHYIIIDLKLFKYLNAINDFEERVKFYTNYERREFVLRLERDSVTSVGLSSGIYTKAVFQEINENESTIFITVELLERPFKYSLPANMVDTIAAFDSSQMDNRGWFEKCLARFCCCRRLEKRPTRNFDYSALEYWRCDDNVQNGTTSNVSRGQPVSNGVLEKFISQNPGNSGQQENLMLNRPYNEPENDFTRKAVGRNSKRDENRCETQVDSVLIVPSSLPTVLLTNFEVCHICSNVREGNICHCVNETKNIFDLNSSKTNIDSNISSDTSSPTDIIINSKVCVECLNVYEGNICFGCDLEKNSGQNNSQTYKSLDSSLFSETPISSLKINTHHEINNLATNEDRLLNNSKVAVSHNISASNYIICNNHLNTSDGFELLCKHTFCETCIKNRINLETLAHTNIMACCDRPFEQDEIKHFLPAHEYEQFKESYKQQCFDKNCMGYHLWEKCVEERPITFACNKCKLENCSKCVTTHVNLTCEQYDKIRNSVDMETGQVFLTWIREGTAMPCSNCEALIEKDEGGDWVQCPFCNVEICWATRGPRWGPKGKGDTSGGCGCDFKVKKCVENCNYCH